MSISACNNDIIVQRSLERLRAFVHNLLKHLWNACLVDPNVRWIEQNLRHAKPLIAYSHSLLLLLHHLSLLGVHVHRLLLRHFLRHLLFFERHVVDWVPGKALLHGFVVGKHVLLDHRIDLFSAAYLQLLLEVLGHIANILFHLVDQVGLSLKIHLLIRDELVKQVGEQLPTYVKAGRCVP